MTEERGTLVPPERGASTPATIRPPDLARIAAAPAAIDPALLDTPLVAGTALDGVSGAGVWLKVETLTPIRSFKGRGTEYLAAALLARGEAGPMVCASAGNFGQGLARAGARRGLPVTVFAAHRASPLKLAAMRALGADVRLAGHDFDAAKDAARAHAVATGARYVEDGALPEIAEGAGTIARELLAAMDARGGPPDAVLVPLGNGALATGVGAWARHAAPGVRVVAVAAEGAPSMRLSFDAGRPVATPEARTIADGIAVREPVPYAVACMAATVDEVVTVTDADIVRAMRLLLAHVGLVVEPAGAAGLAAMLAGGDRWRGRRVATVLCGGNVTAEQMRAWGVVGDESGAAQIPP